MTYRPDIDGLRAIAVSIVVLVHAFPEWFRGGFIGVDVFFVISGFLISSLILKDLEAGTFTFSKFYSQRFRRIAPALTVILLASWLVGRFTLLADEFRALGRDIAAGATYTSNLFYWKDSDYFDSEAKYKPLLHLWSLAVEEQFYLVWPFLLLVFFNRGRIGRLLVTLTLVSLSLSLTRTNSFQSEAFYLLPHRFWELLAGAALAYWKPSPGNLTTQNVRSAVGILALIFGVLVINDTRIFPGAWALLPVLSAVLILSSPNAWLNRKVLSNPLFVGVGLISYPLYLWHWPLLSFARISRSSEGINHFETIGLIFVAFVLAWSTFRFVEQPIRNFSFRGLKSVRDQKKCLVTALASIALLLAVGVATEKSLLFSPFQRQTAEFTETYSNYTSHFQELIRASKCHLESNAPEEFDSTCYKTNSKRNIVLWGDSHAAQLYPGLRKLVPDDISILQFTRGVCPPFLSFPKRANCDKGIKFAMDIIEKVKPDILILAAMWFEYDQMTLLDELIRTIRFAEKHGTKVVVVGPFPVWNTLLYKIVAKEYLNRGREVPERSNFQVSEFWRIGEKIETRLKGTAATYISMDRELCNQNGCKWRLGDDLSSDLITFDNAHLTQKASEFVSAGFIMPVLNKLLSLRN